MGLNGGNGVNWGRGNGVGMVKMGVGEMRIHGNKWGEMGENGGKWREWGKLGQGEWGGDGTKGVWRENGGMGETRGKGLQRVPHKDKM